MTAATLAHSASLEAFVFVFDALARTILALAPGEVDDIQLGMVP